MAAQSKGPHAIVIGASIAGLLSARALSNYFERVTLVLSPDGFTE